VGQRRPGRFGVFAQRSRPLDRDFRGQGNRARRRGADDVAAQPARHPERIGDAGVGAAVLIEVNENGAVRHAGSSEFSCGRRVAAMIDLPAAAENESRTAGRRVF
jgi:hypothetical protein